MKISKLFKSVWDFLGSRNISVFIFVMALTNVIILLAFSLIVPLLWVENISTLLPYQFLYVIFFVNLIICEIKWASVVIRRCRSPKIPETDDDIKRFRHRLEVTDCEFQVENSRKYLKRRGYRVWNSECEVRKASSGVKEIESSPILYAHRGRFSPLGNIIFHTSFLFLLLGVLISMFYRFEGSAMITEGFGFSGSPREYKSISPSPMSSIPEVAFNVERISASFWEGKLLFTNMEAKISHKGGAGIAKLSSHVDIDGANITLSSYGYAPMYILKDKLGRELDKGIVNMNILIPQKEDHFSIPGYPHQIFVKFYPDHEVKDGMILSKSMDTVNPAYYVRIFRGRLPVYSGILKPGEDAQFDGLKLSFPYFYRWGDFRIVKDPGHLYIWIAFVMMISGLAWRLLFYRREIVIRYEKGKIGLYGVCDYNQKLFEAGLKRLSHIICKKM